MSEIVKNIIVDSSGKTLGATVDINGHVRSRSGNLPKVIYKDRPNMVEQSEMYKAKKLISTNPMVIYHGNKDKNMVPQFGIGKKTNDYGSGLYTTPNKELGKEWAYSVYSQGNQGYIHTYELDTTGLNILDLTQKHSLHWIAELLFNRNINTDGKEALQDTIETFIEKYKLDTSKYDIIIGYRADDSYFKYATDFIEGGIYLDTLELALRNGDLGIQVFVKSQKAFNQLGKAVSIEPVDISYSKKYKTRDINARDKYERLKREEVRLLRKDRRKISDFI